MLADEAEQLAVDALHIRLRSPLRRLPRLLCSSLRNINLLLPEFLALDFTPIGRTMKGGFPHSHSIVPGTRN